MAKRISKSKSESKSKSGAKTSKIKSLKSRFALLKEKFKNRKRISVHRSFKRSYREDYVRELEVPGMWSHIMRTLRLIFKNWKVFLPLLVLSVVMGIAFIGLMSESSYQQFREVLDQTTTELGRGELDVLPKAGLLLISTITTGGLSGESTEAATVFAVLIFIMIWLVTIFLLRHIMAKKKVKFRDALYNSMSPLVPSFIVFMVAVLQCVPIFILIIVLSAAVQTEFLATPFYALVFFIFAALMILLSGYLLSSSLMAFVAVSAPGLYPGKALKVSAELMQGRRTRFILRLVAMFFALILMWVIVMLPLIMFDLVMKQFEWTSEIPFVPVCLLAMTCFTGIYITAYLYIYYRWMLGYDGKEEK